MRRSSQSFFAVAFLVLAGTLFAGSWFLLDYSLMPSMQRSRQLDSKLRQMQRAYPQIRAWSDSLKKSGLLRDSFILMPIPVSATMLSIFVRHGLRIRLLC